MKCQVRSLSSGTENVSKQDWQDQSSLTSPDPCLFHWEVLDCIVDLLDCLVTDRRIEFAGFGPEFIKCLLK